MQTFLPAEFLGPNCFINGVGEELFFRDVSRRKLADALSHPANLNGGIAALEARRADNLISATTLHLVWSIGMALLPVVMG